MQKQYKKQINGYGYKHQVHAIRDLFTREGKLQTGELINIANETEDGIKIVNKKLNRVDHGKYMYNEL